MHYDEAYLKGKLVEQLRGALQGFVIIRHEDHFTSGIPDISITGNGVTSWWEAKYANPVLVSKGVQEITMQRLARAGNALYVIYSELEDTRATRVVHPSCVDHRQPNGGTWRSHYLGILPNFAHRLVLEHVREIHHLPYDKPIYVKRRIF